jgi:hypothetical protein
MEKARDNLHRINAGENGRTAAVSLCLSLYAFHVVAWALLVLILLPLIVIAVQYFLAFNIVILEFAIESFFEPEQTD